MLRDILPDLDYASLARAGKRLRSSENGAGVRVALLSDAATQHLAALIKTVLHQHGFDASIYEAPFDAIELECYNSSSDLYTFQPDFVVVLNSVQALRAAFSRRKQSADAFIEEESSKIAGIWEAIQKHSTAMVLQSTFVLPYDREFGNFSLKVPGSFYSAAVAINARIVEQARSRNGVLINDVDHVAAWHGRRDWFDDRLWDLAKSICSLDRLPALAHNIADVIVTARGRVTKCVVLDLDNTLWGGVIGDDGVDGIHLNAHGDGECYYRLQCYLKELTRRGVLLAVCSKNDMHNAVLPFDKHPDMVLRREDIAVFVANWRDKAENIRAIRDMLNIGLDSMVFLDDNPFERNLVRELTPGITVPELPEDPADYVKFISELGLFEATSFSTEDSKRTDMYRQEAQRREEQAAYASVEDFLRSLDMRLVVNRFDSFHLPRIAQLIQRSNQFNLVTNRHTEAECEAMMRDESVIPLYAKLHDRLGDHGLVSIVILRPEAGRLEVGDWLMSCRVLTRGVEQCLMNETVETAKSLGLPVVSGRYVPTAKNQMVKDFFAQFGFRKAEELPNGEARWELDVAAYQPCEVFIRIEEPATAATT